MWIFIFEHVSGGGMANETLPAGLVQAGQAMLQAVVDDFLAINVEVQTTLDIRAQRGLCFPAAHVRKVDPGQPIDEIFDHLANQADAALIIAPESGRILERWISRLAKLGTPHLGCDATAAAVCGDKLASYACLQEAGVSTPATQRLMGHTVVDLPAIVKPCDGVGCEDTFVCRDQEQLALHAVNRGWVVQPYVEGVPVSISFLVHGARVRPLLSGLQTIDGDRQLTYRGGQLPLTPDLHERASRLGSQAIQAVVEATVNKSSVPLADGADDQAISGIGGFVGVDLILVIGIRPTTWSSRLIQG